MSSGGRSSVSAAEKTTLSTSSLEATFEAESDHTNKGGERTPDNENSVLTDSMFRVTQEAKGASTPNKSIMRLKQFEPPTMSQD